MNLEITPKLFSKYPFTLLLYFASFFCTYFNIVRKWNQLPSKQSFARSLGPDPYNSVKICCHLIFYFIKDVNSSSCIFSEDGWLTLIKLHIIKQKYASSAIEKVTAPLACVSMMSHLNQKNIAVFSAQTRLILLFQEKKVSHKKNDYLLNYSITFGWYIFHNIVEKCFHFSTRMTWVMGEEN